MKRALVLAALAACGPGKPVPDPESFDDAFRGLSETTVADPPPNLLASDGAHGVVFVPPDVLEIHDLSDPLAPTLTASYPGVAGDSQQLVFSDGVVYLFAARDGGVDVYDLAVDAGADATPAHHVVLADARLPVAVAGEVFYAGHREDADRLDAFDVRGLAEATAGDVAVTAQTTLAISVGETFELRVAGGLLHAASAYGLFLFDLDDPLAPAPLSRVGIGHVDAFAYDGDHVVTIGIGPSQVTDVSDPAAPISRGTFDIPRAIGPLASRDGYIYVPTGGGLYIVDVSDRTAPAPVKTFTIFPDPTLLVPAGDHLIAGSDSYYRVYRGNRP